MSQPMSTTAWRFNGTEGADAAVLRLKQLDDQDLIDAQDVTLIRWPAAFAGSAPRDPGHENARPGVGDQTIGVVLTTPIV
jgi:hypothetical protein